MRHISYTVICVVVNEYGAVLERKTLVILLYEYPIAQIFHAFLQHECNLHNKLDDSLVV